MPNNKDDHDFYEMKTSIALIQQDIKQIENYFSNMDKVVDKLVNIDKTLINHQNMIDSQEKQISSLKEEVQHHVDREKQVQDMMNEKIEAIRAQTREEMTCNHNLVIEKIDKLSSSIQGKFDKQETRLTEQDVRTRSLENWKWYVIGIVGVIVIVVTNFPWTMLANG